ncbi:hypothetical protein LZC95_53190 [Pendulispora brunnea]|uniref:Uncharacterized protein n=1 Tax=Pendulispora brunnea TaxID=2905690 RepID=A0ABZ2KDK2_9BACT
MKWCLFLAAAVSLGVFGCHSKTSTAIKEDAHTAGEAVETGARKAGDGVETGIKKTGEAFGKVGEGIGNGLEKAGKGLQRAGDKITSRDRDGGVETDAGADASR